LRIIGGRLRARALTALKGKALRPTSDRARESLFNILEHTLEGGQPDGAAVLDVFAGTGALGLEALSRGAARVTFIDNGRAALDCARRNARALGCEDVAVFLGLDATRLPPPGDSGEPATLAFLDPPYGSNLAEPALRCLAAQGWIAPGAVLVIEAGARDCLALPAGFNQVDERAYGAARVMFLKFSG
jgi:16S rRNA (guanine966-N2)-methyltransferase